MASADVGPADPIGGATPASFKLVTSARFDLALPLPDGASFEVDDKSERWFVATHKATGSVLRVRLFREDDNQNHERCEAKARLASTLPEREGSRLIDRRRIAFPPEHDTIAEARLWPKTKGESAEGVVLAFGGWAKKCFAFVFTTYADDERIVVARLATIVDGSLSRARVQTDLLPSRVPHEVAPLAP